MKNMEDTNFAEDKGLDDLLDGKKRHWDFKNLKEGGVSWWTRMLLRVSPLRGMKRFSRELGANPDIADKAQDLFGAVKRVDIVPLGSGTRGFQLILDQSTALYFYQDGDHFAYDGFEMGDYEKGDVTVFD